MTATLHLQLTLFIPLIASLLIALAHRRPNLREAITLIAALLLAANVLSLLPDVLRGERPYWLLARLGNGVDIQLTLEPLGMLFALVAALLWPINSLYSIGYMRANKEKHQTRFYVCFALALVAAMGIATAGNVLTLFVFYEMLSISTYPLVTHKGTPEAMRAGRTYLGILIGSSIALFLMALAWTQAIAGTTDFQTGGLLANQIQGGALGLLLALYVFGIGKAALMPLHRWLPAAMVAPTPVSALLHAVAVVKAGVFSVLKIIVYIFGIDALRIDIAAAWLPYVAAFSLVAASIIALTHDNLKRRLAYSTISQLAYITLAASLYTPFAVMGGLLHIAAHAFGKITLFFAAGSIYTATHKTEVSALNGLGRVMPWTFTAFAIGAVSMIGLPPAAGFISKWYILQGAQHQWVALVALLLSTLLSIGYLMPILYRAFFLKLSPEDQAHQYGEAPWTMVLALMLTASLTIVMFLWPSIPLQLAQALVAPAI